MTTKGRIQLSVVTFCLLLFLLVAQLTRIQNENGSTVIQTLAHKVKQIGQFRGNLIKHGYQEPDGLRPCGQICSYDGEVVGDDGGLYPELRKEINCDNIIQRMSFKNYNIVYPPPEAPPGDMLDEFTMFGKMPISKTKWYKRDEIKDNDPNIFPTKMLNLLVERVKRNDSVNMYLGGKCVQDTLEKHADKIKGKRGVVIGTQFPWLEAILLANDAGFVTTLEYRNTSYPDQPKLDAYTPYEFADRYAAGNAELFDFAATFSSLEHSGLGRYTDPLNPYGDLEAAAQIWCMVKPGGMFALGVPGGFNSTTHNYIDWNAHRMYGPVRLQQLTANWHLVENTYCAIHHFLVLIKPID